MLCVQNCPQLYARLFRVHFNIDCITRRLRLPLTDERLAAEFIQRFQAVRRIRLHQFSEDGLRIDLWTVYMMILESDGANERLLFTGGISEFIWELMKHRLGNEYTTHGWPLATEINSLALWVACLTLSPKQLAAKHPQARDEMHDLLRPLIIAFGRYPVVSTETPTSSSSSLITTPDNPCDYTGSIPPAGTCEVLYYSTSIKMSCPNIYSAAILFAFLIKQSCLDKPTHLPPRAVLQAMQNTGLAVEDLLPMTQYQTPTVRESCNSLPLLFSVADNQFSRSMMHSDDYIRAISDSAPKTFNCTHAYAPGVLTGMWDGQYMDSPYPVPDLKSFKGRPSEFPNFLSKRPMQFRLREHMDSYPDGNLPTPSRGSRRPRRRDTPRPISSDVIQASAGPHELHIPERTQISIATEASPTSPSTALTGETQSIHEQMCGAFKYTGNVRFRDGLIVLKREPKRAEESYYGTWIFQGYLHSRRVIVGRWHSSTSDDGSDRREGVFCMSKRPEVMVRDTSWPARL